MLDIEETQKIAVYGKGGIGKSTIATAFSAHFGMEGYDVLHIGCDPKADSALHLLDEGEVPTVLDALGDDALEVNTEDIITEGRHGIHLCESGGPKPGLGCGGRGVARCLEFLDEMDVIEGGDYDMVLFDVLGDVVCGGFAAPLRRRFAEKIVIVTSEEPMALFAANNISKAVEVYAANGVSLAGIMLNLRSPDTDPAGLHKFAERLNSRVIGCLPRDPVIQQAEIARKTIVEYAPDGDSSTAIKNLAETVCEIEKSDMPLPTPMSEDELFAFMREVGLS